ncbi:MAG TPA: MBL fold metallo-hydrolase [Eubacteriales bacterium]|nr:MBL fold metallo-hydrolase [Eubacteriales bacterium]
MRFEHLVCGALGVNTYIIGSDHSDDCIVIDPGTAAPVLAALKKNGLACKAILLTHGHFDHIGGVRKLKEQTGAKVYIHEADAEMLRSNRASLAVLTGDLLESAEPDVLLQGGETLEIAGLTIKVLHTPGHTKGGVSYILEEEHKLFCGDTLFRESVGRTDFPGGSEAELYRSIKQGLFALDGDYEVFCGHEGNTTLDYERWNNPFILAIERRG